jgi:hypothetical protein
LCQKIILEHIKTLEHIKKGRCQMGSKISKKREELEFCANDLDVEFDADINDEELERQTISALDALDDGAWDKLDDRTKAWSNDINRARLEKRKGQKKKTSTAKAKTATKSTAKAKTATKSTAKAKTATKSTAKAKTATASYRENTTAWHVQQIIVESGAKGISMNDALPLFEAQVKKLNLKTTNAKSRVNTIMRQCVQKGLAVVKDDKYISTGE